jgi:hypothetical protein
VAAPPPWGVALTVAMGTGFDGQGASIRSTGQVGPARTRPVIPPVTASDRDVVLDGPPDRVSEGGAVSAARWDPQPDVVVALTRAIIAMPLGINPISRICPKSP